MSSMLIAVHQTKTFISLFVLIGNTDKLLEYARQNGWTVTWVSALTLDLFAGQNLISYLSRKTWSSIVEET